MQILAGQRTRSLAECVHNEYWWKAMFPLCIHEPVPRGKTVLDYAVDSCNKRIAPNTWGF